MIGREVFLLAAWMLLGACVAEAKTLRVDEERSTFEIEVEASPPPHSFTVVPEDLESRIEISQSGDVLSAEFSFDVAALDTGIESRNSKMRSWINVEQHPKVRFELLQTRREGERRVGVGEVSMHGVKRRVEVPFDLSIENGEARLTGGTTLDYRDWGLEVISLLFIKVKPEIDISFTLVGQLE